MQKVLYDIINENEIKKLKYGPNCIIGNMKKKLIVNKTDNDYIISKNYCKHQGGMFVEDVEDIVKCCRHGWKLNTKTLEYTNPENCYKQERLIQEFDDGNMLIFEYKEEFWNVDHYFSLPFKIESKNIDLNIFNVQFINHACLKFICDDITFYTDPWLIGSGISRGWWLLYKSQDDWLKNICKANFIWISHNHEDHLNIHTLKEIYNVNPNLCFIMGDLKCNIWIKKIQDIGFKNVYFLNFHIWYKINNNTKIMIIKDAVAPDLDTALLIQYKDKRVFINVDCNNPNNGILPNNIDLLLSDFASGASGFPSLFYEMFSEEKVLSLAESKKLSFRKKVKGLIEKTGSKGFIPYAGYFTEAHPTDNMIKKLNIKNNVDDILKEFKEDFKDLCVWKPFPNGLFNILKMQGEELTRPIEDYYENDWNFNKYLLEYEQYNDHIFFEGNAFLQEYFKWANFKNYDLILHIVESSDDFKKVENNFLVDFINLTFPTEIPSNRNYLRMRVRKKQFRKILIEGDLWEAFYSGFGARYYVEPDIFHYNFIGHFSWRLPQETFTNFYNETLQNFKTEKYKDTANLLLSNNDTITKNNILNEEDNKISKPFIVYYENEKYDIGSFLHQHPGGSSILLDYENKEIKQAFMDFNHSNYALNLLKKYKLSNIHNKKDIVYKIIKKVNLNHNTIRLDLETDIKDEIDNKENLSTYYNFNINNISRPYTPIKYDNDSNNLSFIIKIYNDGKLTPIINNLSENDSISLEKQSGSLTEELIEKYDIVNYICGGSGITPLFKLIDYFKYKNKQPKKFTVLNSIRNTNDLILTDNVNNINLHNIITSQQGRINLETLEKYFTNEKQLFILCGPKNMEINLTKIIKNKYLDSQVIVL